MINLDKLKWQFKVLEGMKLHTFLKLKNKTFSKFVIAFNDLAPNSVKDHFGYEMGVFDAVLYFYTNDVDYTAWGTSKFAIEFQLLYNDYGKSWIVLRKGE